MEERAPATLQNNTQTWLTLLSYVQNNAASVSLFIKPIYLTLQAFLE